MEPDLTEQLPVAAVGVRPGDKEQPSPGVSPVKLPRDAVKCHRPGPGQVGSHHRHEGAGAGVRMEGLDTRMSSVRIREIYCP